MRIAVTTPNGTVGRHVLRSLVRAGERPVVLTRDVERLDPELRGLVEARRCDLGVASDVVSATEGVDALYWATPSPPFDDPDPVETYHRFGSHLAAAVTDNGIGRVVFQSSVGAELRKGAGEIDGLAATEELLDATDADVTHLRCGYFFTNLLFQVDDIRGGVLSTVMSPDKPMPWVSARDIAEVAVGRLLADWSGRHVHGVHGPRDLSWNEVAALIAKVTGREVRVEQAPADAMRAALETAGLGPARVEATVGMLAFQDDRYVSEPIRTAASTTPEPLEAWLWHTLRPLLTRPGDAAGAGSP